jgi:hypothetical protein
MRQQSFVFFSSKIFSPLDNYSSADVKKKITYVYGSKRTKPGIWLGHHPSIAKVGSHQFWLSSMTLQKFFGTLPAPVEDIGHG